MTPADAFRRYIAFKNHFKGSLDFFKYKNLKSIKYTTFEKRKDKRFFYRLAEEKNLDFLLLANFLEDKNRWIGDIIKKDIGRKAFDEWKPRIFKLTENYETEIQGLKKSDLLSTDVFKKTFLKEISLETFVVLNSIFKLTEKHKEHMDCKYLYSDLCDLTVKYQPFLEKVMDKKKLKEITEDHFFS